MARRIKAGTVMINDMISGFGISEAPHGGLKLSGIGRTHGKMGLAEMVQVKYVDTDLLPGNAEGLVVRIRPQTQTSDGWLHRCAVRQKLGRKSERRHALGRFAAALSSNLAATKGGLYSNSIYFRSPEAFLHQHKCGCSHREM